MSDEPAACDHHWVGCWSPQCECGSASFPMPFCPLCGEKGPWHRHYDHRRKKFVAVKGKRR